MPRTIKKFYHKIVLASDAMLLNHVPFLTSVYEYVHYRIVGAVDDLKSPSLEYGSKEGNLVLIYAGLLHNSNSSKSTAQGFRNFFIDVQFMQ